MPTRTSSPGLPVLGDVLLATLSDLGDASWERFESICEVLGIRASRTFRRSLDRLGHLEVLAGERRQLSCAPAGFVEAAPGSGTGFEAFLTGRRDDGLVQRIGETALLLGVHLELTSQAPFPTRLSIRAEDRGDLMKVAELCEVQ